MKYTYIHILLQEKHANDFLKLAALSHIDFMPAERTAGSCYLYYRTGISHIQNPNAEDRIKTFLIGVIEISSDIVYRIEKV